MACPLLDQPNILKTGLYMPHHNWENCPAETKQRTINFVEKLKTDLGDNLTGVCLHGSLAMGCFNPKTSDIDMLIITEQPLTSEQQRSMAQITLDCSPQPIGFEVSSVSRTYFEHWEHPCRYDFHFSPDWHEKLSSELASGQWQEWTIPQGKDNDLAAHITVTNHRGVVLYGQPIKNVFPAVPAAHYRDAIVDDFYWLFKHNLQYEEYGVTNMCRVLQFLKTGAVSSKAEGCTWALTQVPAIYHPLIQAALLAYRDDTPLTGDKSVFDAFSAYMKQQIEAAL
jgi:hypothetical protein